MDSRSMRFILSAAIVTLAAVILAACGGDDVASDGSSDAGVSSVSTITSVDDLAPWLQQLIAGIESEPVWNPPARITSYEYRGSRVYFVPADCCDKLSSLYDEDGNVICSPDGGIGGAGDGRCPDFFDVRKDGELVWEDSRS